MLYWIVLIKCEGQEFNGWVTGYLVEQDEDVLTIATRVHVDGTPNHTLGVLRRHVTALFFIEQQQFFPKKEK